MGILKSPHMGISYSIHQDSIVIRKMVVPLGGMVSLKINLIYTLYKRVFMGYIPLLKGSNRGG